MELIGSGELEAMLPNFASQELDNAAQWLLDDPSPAGSNPLFAGSDGLTSPTGVAGLPPHIFGDQQLLLPPLGAAPDGGLSPMPLMPAGAEAWAPPLPHMPTSDSSGAASGGSAGGAAAAAVTSAAPGGRGGARGGKKELTEEQKERIKAKNRRAQTRYREKKKAEAAAAEAEFAATARELERMRLEHGRLQEQQSAMQRVLEVREAMVGMLESGKEAAVAAAAAEPPPACGCPSLAQCTCAQPGGTAAQRAAAQMALCHSLPGGGGAGEGGCPLTGLTLSEIAELKQHPPEVVQQRWRGLAERLSSTLQQLSAAQRSEDASLAVRAEQLEEEVQETLREGQLFCFEYAVHQPTSVQRLFGAVLDDGRSHASLEDAERWAAVAGSLELSESQLQRLEAARSQFLERIAEVCAERRQIFDRLQALQVPDVTQGLRAMQHATASWLKVHEATAELTANMNREHCVCMTFVRDSFGFVLSPMQKATAIVRAFPFFPDMFSISSAALKAPHPAPLAAPGAPALLAAGAAQA